MHAARPALASRYPVHVTLKMKSHVPSLRSERSFEVIGMALVLGGDREHFRVPHFSVQGNHLHLVVEATNTEALSRGMQGLTVRIARGLNKMMGLAGAVFADRYHARILRSPREVRNALAYVLQNFRRHAAQRKERLPPHWVDPYSSGAAFDGWREPVNELPVIPPARPVTWLLGVGWRKRGLISTAEVPTEKSAA